VEFYEEHTKYPSQSMGSVGQVSVSVFAVLIIVLYALFLCCSQYKLCLYLCALSVGAQTKEGVCEGRCELYEV
jgi:hypothetical protein